eukprot:scaffold29504_cov129-Isochrysis_galbana.AAC.2
MISCRLPPVEASQEVYCTGYSMSGDVRYRLQMRCSTAKMSECMLYHIGRVVGKVWQVHECAAWQLGQDTRGGASCHTTHQRHRQQLETDDHSGRADGRGCWAHVNTLTPSAIKKTSTVVSKSLIWGKSRENSRPAN